MARISGVNIPTNKRVLIALTYIFGIGPKIASEICSKASIDLSKRVNQLTDEEVNKIREIINQFLNSTKFLRFVKQHFTLRGSNGIFTDGSI